MKKRVLAFVLSIMMAFSTFAFMTPVHAEIIDSGKCGDINWEVCADGSMFLHGDGDFSYDYCDMPCWWEYRDFVTSVTINIINITHCEDMFYGFSKLDHVNIVNFFTENVERMDGMFYGCSSLQSLDLSSLDTSNVTRMDNMFHGCKSLTSLDISSFDTSNVTNMYSMFYNCAALTDLNVSNFDTSKVTDMQYMFSWDSALTHLDLSSFTTDQVTDMSYMFYYDPALTTLDVSNFDISNVTTMSYMFYYCSSLTGLDLSSFGANQVTSMNRLFYYCQALTDLDVSNLDTSHVTDMQYMFFDCWELQNLDLSSFDTSNVTNMECMFTGCLSMESCDVSSFDTSNVTNMYQMFGYNHALTYLDLSGFDTSLITDVSYMFAECYVLNTDITFSGNITDYTGCFYYAANDNNAQITIRNSGACTDEIINKILNTKCNGCNVVISNTILTGISSCTVTLSTSVCRYNGAEKKPIETVSDGSTKLVAGTDYTVSYTNNVNVGLAKVTIKGIGNYSGSANYSFKIVPGVASVSSITAGNNSMTVNMAATQSALGATYYEFKYRPSDGGTWIVESSSEQRATFSGLAVGKKYQVYVRAYKDVDSERYYGSWSTVAESPVIEGTSITTQPSNVTVVNGQKASFKVVASGSGLTYLWQYSTNGSSWTNTSQKSSVLSFTAATSHNGRYYRCVITDANGNKVTSNAAKLTVTSLAITTQPSNVTVVAGKTATFKVVASGSGLTYLWQYSTNGTSWANTSQKTATLSFTAASSHSGRYYRCKVTDSSGKTVTSNAAKLTVTSLAITTQPSNVTVVTGQKATFKVAAAGSGLTYLWQYSTNGTSWTNTSQKTATLSFTSATAHNGRYYRCKVTDANGNTVTSNAAKLTVQSFGIVTQPSNVTVSAGKTATFKVVAAGSGLTYLWQYSTNGTSWANTSQKTATLSFTAATAHNGRYYRCIISDANGNTVTSQKVKLTVQ